MAFFNLTQLGVQDPIKTSLRDVDCTTMPPGGASTKSGRPSETPQRKSLPSNDNEAVRSSHTSAISFRHTVGTARGSSEAKGSHVKYTERLTKHQRPTYGEQVFFRCDVANNWMIN